jgi:hypothetical protein
MPGAFLSVYWGFVRNRRRIFVNSLAQRVIVRLQAFVQRRAPSTRLDALVALEGGRGEGEGRLSAERQQRMRMVRRELEVPNLLLLVVCAGAGHGAVPELEVLI